MGDERCVCGHPRHKAECYDCIRYDLQTVCIDYRPAPSPARDDAEKAIAGLLDQHQQQRGIRDGKLHCICGWESGWPRTNRDHLSHVASVIAAHMAAPDELTALRRRMAELESSAANRFAMFQSAQNEITGLKAERDALRERIRALADEWAKSARDGAEQAEAEVGREQKQHYADLSENYEYFASRLRAALGDE